MEEKDPGVVRLVTLFFLMPSVDAGGGGIVLGKAMFGEQGFRYWLFVHGLLDFVRESSFQVLAAGFILCDAFGDTEQGRDVVNVTVFDGEPFVFFVFFVQEVFLLVGDVVSCRDRFEEHFKVAVLDADTVHVVFDTVSVFTVIQDGVDDIAGGVRERLAVDVALLALFVFNEADDLAVEFVKVRDVERGRLDGLGLLLRLAEVGQVVSPVEDPAWFEIILFTGPPDDGVAEAAGIRAEAGDIVREGNRVGLTFVDNSVLGLFVCHG